MITLFNGCSRSEFSVHPKNWKETGVSINDDWYIHYRFYDPTIAKEDGNIKPKLCAIKGMNKYKTLAKRREITQKLISDEIDELETYGWNPITKTYMAPGAEQVEQTEINENTPCIKAFRSALENLIVTPKVKKGIRLIIDGVEAAAIQLRYTGIPISQLTRKRIKALLKQCGANSTQWSNNRFNCYRGYLMMLFKELVELEAAPSNPMRDISKLGVTKRIKKVLSAAERKLINEHLEKVFPDFHKFVHLFFHCGGRKTELMQLKPGSVDLVNQTYRCVIKKRKTYEEVDRTIKTIAIPFWEHFLKDCPADHFIFGPKLQHGLKPFGQDMPTLYWNKFVKKQPAEGGLGIQIDFYALKHLNLTEISDQHGNAVAGDQAGHKDEAMVVQIYDVKQLPRNHEKLKAMNNAFAN